MQLIELGWNSKLQTVFYCLQLVGKNVFRYLVLSKMSAWNETLYTDFKLSSPAIRHD